MINYCTLVYGKKLCELYSSKLNEFAKNNKLFVYTNYPDYFPNCKTVKYTRDVFSYYEKLPFILSLVNKLKQRVLYFDVDSIDLIKDNSYEFDDESVYSFKIFKNSSYSKNELKKELGLSVLCDIYDELGSYTCDEVDYVHERIISIPCYKNIESILEEIIKLQPIFEERFSKNKNWPNHIFQKYSKIGCGYGEGGALSLVLKDNNLKIKKLISNILI